MTNKVISHFPKCCNCITGVSLLSGDACNENVNECEVGTAQCANGATCQDTEGSFLCLCPDGTTGNYDRPIASQTWQCINVVV